MRLKQLLPFLVSLLVGCNLVPVSVSTSSVPRQTRELSATSTFSDIVSTVSMSPTVKIVSHTPTPSPVMVSSPLPVNQLKRQCLPIDSAELFNAKIEGLPILSGYGYYSYISNYSYLLDLREGAKVFLPHDEDPHTIKNLHTSPNQQSFAYRDMDDNRLVVATDKKQLQLNIAWDNSWNYISGWLDDENLLISRNRGENVYNSLIVLNVITGQEKSELIPDYPHIRAGYPAPNWYWFDDSKTIYSPDLSRVVYPGIDENGTPRLFLWDRSANLQIAVITGTDSFGVTPQWSPDGQRFIINGPSTLLTDRLQLDPFSEHQELFSVNREGQITRLTYLTDAYSEVRFYEYAWSPDGRYIAFRFSANPNLYPDLYPTTKPSISGRLAVMDMTSLDIVDYCIPSGLSVIPPVWSPSSQQVIVEDYYQSTPPFKGNVYLIDIKFNFATQIADDVAPFGWIKSSP